MLSLPQIPTMQFMHYLKLIRVNNLLIIAGTLVLMRYAVIHPVYEANGAQGAMSDAWFFLFLIHTLLIAAAGNIINDYFDTHIDEVNKPQEVIVGKIVPRKTAMMYHQVLTGIGAALGLILAYRLKSVSLAFLLLFIPGLLWFYSSVYKRQFLIGNVIIAFLCALVPLTLVFIENGFLYQAEGEAVVKASILKAAYAITGFFALFAFLTTLIREIVKDIIDEEGDRELECATLPIVLGLGWTKLIITTLTVLTILLIGWIYQSVLARFDDSLSFYFLLFLVVIPLVVVIILSLASKTNYDFERVSALLKYIMTAGTLFALVLYLLLARNFDIPFFNLIVQ